MNIIINDDIFDAFPELESKRLSYRAYRLQDASALYDIRGHKSVAKYMDSEIPKSDQDTKQRIQKMQSDFQNKKGITWAIIDKDSGKLIGDFGIWRIDKANARGEIGYVLHPDYWGKGYMSEATHTIISFGFNHMKLHSFEANVNPMNSNSKAMLLKFGFRLEAHFRENYYYNGQFLDSEIYCLLKSDFH
ncbi:GNAT family N-acetyltransferase [Psychroserpens sp. BH13MA-6]